MRFIHLITLVGLLPLAPLVNANKVIHDAEYSMLKAKNGKGK